MGQALFSLCVFNVKMLMFHTKLLTEILNVKRR